MHKSSLVNLLVCSLGLILANCSPVSNRNDETSMKKSRSRRDVIQMDANNTTPQGLCSCIHNVSMLQGPPGVRGPPGPAGEKGDIGKPGLPCKPSIINYPPKVYLPVGPIYVKEGDNLNVSCHVTSYPISNVTWEKVMDSLPSNRSSITANRLQVFSVEKQDSGSYVCVGSSNILGSAVETIKIIVVSAPTFTIRPPQQVEACDKLTLDCQATGEPPVVITWSKESGRLPRDRTQLINGTLTITGIKASDAGKYVCTAVSAGVATSKSVTRVTVKEKRKLKFPRRSVTDYIVVNRKLPAMERLTVCLWVMTLADLSSTMISYAVPKNNNEMVLALDYFNFFFLINGLSMGQNRRPHLKYGHWHHGCVTWDSSSGKVVFYQDGALLAIGNMKKDYKIKNGGSLIIGQRQEKVGGGFKKSNSFVGELTGINIWNKVLGLKEIIAMSKNREIPASGNVVTWNDVISGTKHGEVQIINSCKK